MAQKPEIDSIGAAGADALQRGEFKLAESFFERYAAAAPGDRRGHFGLALARKELGDTDGAHIALDTLLRSNWVDLPALMLKGDLYLEKGDRAAAASFFGLALRHVPPGGAPNRGAAERLRRAREFMDQYSREILDRIFVELSSAGYRKDQSSRRFTESVQILAGAGKRYVEEPLSFYFSGLPAIGFYPRQSFDWLEPLESQTDVISDEFMRAAADESIFVPYVRESEGRPTQYDKKLLNSRDWSALFLVDDGKVIEKNARLFPKTLSILEKTPLHRVDGRGPIILFSRLTPGTIIEPHTGFLNTRLICHLPIIAPAGCALRVGNETRDWKRGEAIVFNDSIEHEAWNKSDRDRVVLLFSVWRPELTAEERGLVSALMVSGFGFTHGGA